MSDWTRDRRLVRAFRPAGAANAGAGASAAGAGAGADAGAGAGASASASADAGADVDADVGAGADTGPWPATVPAAAQLLREGLELTPGITVLVGENGSGKSTVVEILAEAYGLNPQGGSVIASTDARVRVSEPRAGDRLYVELGLGGRSAWAYFLRADTMHSLYTYLEQHPGKSRDQFHELSHGQGFLEILRTRVSQRGFYLMDEPDAPLSFVSCLSLVALLHDLAAADSQVVVATHSPVVAAVPGARILELGDWGIRPARWEELELVRSWRTFLRSPERFLHYLLAEDE